MTISYRESYMRTTFLVVSLNLICLAWGPGVVGQTVTQSRSSAIQRDVKLERAVSDRYRGMMRLLQPEAKRKLAIASRALIKEMVKSPEPNDLEKIARAEVNKRFVGLSAEQSALLSFFALADIAQYATKLLEGGDKKANFEAIETMKNDLDSMSEMGEMESLRLQMAMDRLSKMMTTLSNILKKISDTADGITQNIK